MSNIKEKFDGIVKINKIKENEDGTILYEIIAEKDINIRKQAFEILPKEDVTIFELKKEETSLEETFLKLINENEKELRKLRKAGGNT